MAPTRIAELVGRVLGDRYRLSRPLGAGASAHVYVADDITLRRRVAIKVLHPALADDEAFLRRFRAEARAVAALQHPNILRVYDWGEDAGTPYLVMELLEGGSLRSMLDRARRLSPSQVAKIGADAAHALDYAHRRGIVHRDIKPANLLFDEEARVSVADFGLARALAEASWTEPAGTVIGTARYAAPEAVRGETLGDRADVYALAITLVEAATAEVPFAADTTFATLMARTERPLPVPEELGPLRPVLAWAGELLASERPDAAELADALEDAARHLPAPAPLPLAGPLATGEVERDDQPTEAPGARPRLFDQLEAVGAVGAARATGSIPVATDAPGAALLSGRRRLRWWWVAALLAILAVAGGVAFAQSQREAPSHPVPSLVGHSQAEAAGLLGPLHLRMVVVGRSYDPKAVAGTVTSQQPSTGTLREGEAVKVTLSLGPQPVPVPSLASLTKDEATSVLHTLGLAVGQVSSEASLTVAAGQVIRYDPSQGSLLPGQTVNLVVSSGKPTVAVPALGGPQVASFAAAKAVLAAANLVASEVDQHSDTVAKGQVMGTQPLAGTVVTVQSSVTVVVSLGPDLVAVPAVHGMSVPAASQALSAAGFHVSGVSGDPTATVSATNPPAGALIHRGASVQLITQ